MSWLHPFWNSLFWNFWNLFRVFKTSPPNSLIFFAYAYLYVFDCICAILIYFDWGKERWSWQWGDNSAPETANFEWVCVGDSSEYEGRFGVLSESAPDKDAQGEEIKDRPSGPSGPSGIKTVNASDAFWIELNVQLLQVTVRGRTLVPLEDFIWNDEDFKHVFVSELGEKGAQQKTTVQCSALLTSSNATVRELLSIPFRATYWSSKPANFLPFLDEWDRLYDVEDMEEDEFWIAELFEPVRRWFFSGKHQTKPNQNGWLKKPWQGLPDYQSLEDS